MVSVMNGLDEEDSKPHEEPHERDYLSPMVRSGNLEYTIPETPDHPNQKYKAPD